MHVFRVLERYPGCRNRAHESTSLRDVYVNDLGDGSRVESDPTMGDGGDRQPITNHNGAIVGNQAKERPREALA